MTARIQQEAGRLAFAMFGRNVAESALMQLMADRIEWRCGTEAQGADAASLAACEAATRWWLRWGPGRRLPRERVRALVREAEAARDAEVQAARQNNDGDGR